MTGANDFMKTKTHTKLKGQRLLPAAPCSAYDRYLSALRTVVRHLGGSRIVLLASGYIPADKSGYWLTPHNPHIMWKQRDAIIDIFTAFRWSDRAKLAEKSSMPNVQSSGTRDQMT